MKTLEMSEGSIMCTGDLIPRGLLLWLDISHIRKKETAWAELNLPFDAKRHIYGSYRTSDLQTFHFIYLFNKYGY